RGGKVIETWGVNPSGVGGSTGVGLVHLVADGADSLATPSGQFGHVDHLPLPVVEGCSDRSLKIFSGCFEPVLGALVGAERRHQIPLSHTSMVAYHSHAQYLSAVSRKAVWRMMLMCGQGDRRSGRTEERRQDQLRT